MRANPGLLSGLNVLWIRFFLLAVFSTMYVRDHSRPAFHAALGLDPTEYDLQVFRITTEISRQVFPITLAIDDPRFRAGLDSLCRIASRVAEAKRRGGVAGAIGRGLGAAQAAFTLVRLYLLPVRRHAMPERVRLAPAW